MNNVKKQKKARYLEKARDLFKKIEDIKGTFHAKMGKIKNRNSKNLIEVDWLNYIYIYISYFLY